jgi:hypothetical protein
VFWYHTRFWLPKYVHVLAGMAVAIGMFFWVIDKEAQSLLVFASEPQHDIRPERILACQPIKGKNRGIAFQTRASNTSRLR